MTFSEETKMNYINTNIAIFASQGVT